MQLFYNPHLDTATEFVKFDKKESGHIVKVLRKINGDKLYITNGKGYLYTAVIIDANPNKCLVKITASTYREPLPYDLHLAVAPTKMNDRYEWFLEKVTEIGVSRITPIICEHSERRQVKINRFERVLQSAMKQSLQFHLPKLKKAIPFSEFISSAHKGQKYIAHCEDGEKVNLKEKIKPGSTVTILIGPEGDFSFEEIQNALKTGFEPVSLGLNRLRTETAAVIACHTVCLANS